MGVTGKTLVLCVLFGTLGATTSAEAARSAAHDRGAARSSRDTTLGRSHPSTSFRGAQASSRGGHAIRGSHNIGNRHVTSSGRHGGGRFGRGRRYAGGWGGGLSCVPYARQVTGMSVSGNANMWWHNAAGTYARGQRPEAGSVLTFRGSGGMSRGHVAVVAQVLNSRNVLIDHANWGGPGIRRGSVMTGSHVVDVSPNNDWSAVRVQVGHDDDTFGRTYPTYGFIYNRPDNGGVAYASAAGYQMSTPIEQVAEAPALNAEPRSYRMGGYHRISHRPAARHAAAAPSRHAAAPAAYRARR